MRYKNINLYQSWQFAYNDWDATQAEKRAFKQQFMLIQSDTISTENNRSIDSYFCQIKTGKRPIHSDAENFANQFFSLNRKNK